MTTEWLQGTGRPEWPPLIPPPWATREHPQHSARAGVTAPLPELPRTNFSANAGPVSSSHLGNRTKAENKLLKWIIQFPVDRTYFKLSAQLFEMFLEEISLNQPVSNDQNCASTASNVTRNTQKDFSPPLQNLDLQWMQIFNVISYCVRWIWFKYKYFKLLNNFFTIHFDVFPVLFVMILVSSYLY